MPREPEPRGPAPRAGGAEPGAPLGAWPRAYAVVIAWLAFLILLLLWLTRTFA